MPLTRLCMFRSYVDDRGLPQDTMDGLVARFKQVAAADHREGDAGGGGPPFLPFVYVARKILSIDAASPDAIALFPPLRSDRTRARLDARWERVCALLQGRTDAEVAALVEAHYAHSPDAPDVPDVSHVPAASRSRSHTFRYAIAALSLAFAVYALSLPGVCIVACA